DVKFMVAHCLRFWPEYMRVKEMLDEGVIGEPRIARAYRLSSYPMWSWKLWHKHIELSGGVAVDLMIHDIDFLRWTLGEVNEVFARGGIYLFKDATAHDFMHALLKFKSGAIAYVEGSWIMPKEFPFTTYLEIAGTRGLLVVDNQATATLRLFRRGVQEVLIPVAENAYYLELKHFIECVREDKEPSVSGEEATRSLEVALACIKSVRENRPIKLPLTEEVI
ncbi:MAG: gfo/Idh/MocA family oxidoreductase, partial [Thermoprotei archaeon]